VVRKQTFAEISERCAAVNADLWETELLIKFAGEEEWRDLLLVYRLNEHSCFSWEPGIHELLALFWRKGDDYYSLPVEFLSESQQQKEFDAICGVTEEHILQRERHRRRMEHYDRKRSA
jgi:hypothetical protein